MRGERFLIRLAMAIIAAFGAAHLALYYRRSIEFFLESTTTIILIVGIILFFISFFVYGDRFINVSFRPTAQNDVGQSSFTFGIGAALSFGLFLETRISQTIVIAPVK